MKYSKSLLKFACLATISSGAVIGSVYAAEPVDPGVIIRNIEKNTLDKPTEFTGTGQPSLEAMQAIGILSALNISSEILNKEMRLYWEAKSGQQITPSDIELFKAWAWGQFKARGYLAWLTVDANLIKDRLTLTIEVTTPKLGEVDVDYSNVKVSPSNQSSINKTVRDKFKTNDAIDVVAMDNHIQNANFGLPVEFDARLRQVAPGITDLTIAARPIETKAGKLQNAFIQFNSYGLKQYGREQLLASVNFAGLSPLSQLSVAAQVSEGVNYGRAEYQMPISWLRGVARFYASYADFSSALRGTSATRGESYEYGAGISHLLGLSRYSALKSHLDVSERRTRSELKLDASELTDMRALQGRFSISVDNSKVEMDQYDASMALVGGEYQHSGFNRVNGAYSKFELNGRYVWSLSEDRKTLLASRFRGQYAGTYLDSFDRISVGGVNGVRAYTSVDGIGDTGAVLTFDLIQKLPYQQYAGFFYDVGVVKPFKKALANVDNESYTLQGAGIQYGISYQRLSINMNYAKALGSYKGYAEGNIESEPHNWRGNIAVTLAF